MFGQLPGARKHLVVGNHDSPLTQALPWDSVSWMIEVNDPDAGLMPQHSDSLLVRVVRSAD